MEYARHHSLRLRPFTFSDSSLRFAPAFARGETPFRMTALVFQAPHRLPPRPIAFPSRPASFAAVMHLPNSRLTPLRELSGRAFLRPARGAFLA